MFEEWHRQRSPLASTCPHNVRQTLTKFAQRRKLPTRLIPVLIQYAFHGHHQPAPEQNADAWPKMQVLPMDGSVSGPDAMLLQSLQKEYNTVNNKHGPYGVHCM